MSNLFKLPLTFQPQAGGLRGLPTAGSDSSQPIASSGKQFRVSCCIALIGQDFLKGSGGGIQLLVLEVDLSPCSQRFADVPG